MSDTALSVNSKKIAVLNTLFKNTLSADMFNVFTVGVGAVTGPDVSEAQARAAALATVATLQASPYYGRGNLFHNLGAAVAHLPNSVLIPHVQNVLIAAFTAEVLANQPVPANRMDGMEAAFSAAVVAQFGDEQMTESTDLFAAISEELSNHTYVVADAAIQANSVPVYRMLSAASSASKLEEILANNSAVLLRMVDSEAAPAVEEVVESEEVITAPVEVAPVVEVVNADTLVSVADTPKVAVTFANKRDQLRFDMLAATIRYRIEIESEAEAAEALRSIIDAVEQESSDSAILAALRAEFGHLLNGARFEVPKAVCVVIPYRPKFNDAGVLMVSRKTSQLTGLPAGKVDADESVEAAARREIAEELGISLADVSLVPIYQALCDGYFCVTYYAELSVFDINTVTSPEGLTVSVSDLTDFSNAHPSFIDYNKGVRKALDAFNLVF